MSNVLDADEVSIIKTMLTLRPRLNNQEILSYFTRPGRDINHARIAEIKGGVTWAWVPAAPLAATLAYMTARAALPYPATAHFLHRGGATPAAKGSTAWSVRVQQHQRCFAADRGRYFRKSFRPLTGVAHTIRASSNRLAAGAPRLMTFAYYFHRGAGLMTFPCHFTACSRAETQFSSVLFTASSTTQTQFRTVLLY